MTKDICNKKYEELKAPWMTFFTPTYNREKTLPRCYESLKKMELPVEADGRKVEFEWLIVDDGSQDNTFSLVSGWIEENLIPIRYYYQPNSGKHVASNVSAELSRAEMLTGMDSDDSFLPETLKVFREGWLSIPEDIRPEFRGVTARCIDPETGKMVGTPSPSQPYYVHTQDMRFKDKVTGEMCGFNRVDVLREFPFPVFEEKTSFCPESIVWYSMGEKYKESVIDIPVREYFHDTDNALTGKNTRRSAANYYLWKYEVNSLVLKYLRYAPKDMLKAIVGMSMDGFISGRSIRSILRDVKSKRCKVAVAAFIPAGWVLSKIR